MANIIHKNQVVGQLLIDPVGTNMGIQWDQNIDQSLRDKIWNKFFSEYPTGLKIDDVDLVYDDV